MQPTPSTPPVSYTHLDVYKRQVLLGDKAPKAKVVEQEIYGKTADLNCEIEVNSNGMMDMLSLIHIWFLPCIAVSILIMYLYIRMQADVPARSAGLSLIHI